MRILNSAWVHSWKKGEKHGLGRLKEITELPDKKIMVWIYPNDIDEQDVDFFSSIFGKDKSLIEKNTPYSIITEKMYFISYPKGTHLQNQDFFEIIDPDDPRFRFFIEQKKQDDKIIKMQENFIEDFSKVFNRLMSYGLNEEIREEIGKLLNMAQSRAIPIGEKKEEK